MISSAAVVGIGLIALGMVVTPGPNMVHLASRSISQGRTAGLISLGGVAVGFLCYLAAAACGLSGLFERVPAAYTVVKFAGAAYLAYLAWGMLRVGGTSPFSVRDLAPHSRTRLFTMGWLTSLLNPKIALLYAALLPQFLSADAGSTLWQVAQLGAVQIVVAVTVNGLIVLGAARLAGYLADRPRVMRAQQVMSGTVIGAFAVKMAGSHRPA